MSILAKEHPEPLVINGIISIAEEQKPNDGEDASIRTVGQDASIIAVFDGCGGAGAKRYEAANNKSGAYIAARVGGLATGDWFDRFEIGKLGLRKASATDIGQSLQKHLSMVFRRVYAKLNDVSSMKGSLAKPLPTTMAAAIIEKQEDKARCVFLWAGDSRVFLFSPEGLRQMTTDDIQGNMDALDNLRNDGVLTNLVSATGNFVVHAKEITLISTCMVIVATDGCFAYFLSPLEFEGILLQTLMSSASLSEWQRELTNKIGLVASDDYTMNIAILGYERQEFIELKRAYQPRAKAFSDQYLAPLEVCRQTNDQAGLSALWTQYKKSYM